MASRNNPKLNIDSGNCLFLSDSMQQKMSNPNILSPIKAVKNVVQINTVGLQMLQKKN